MSFAQLTQQMEETSAKEFSTNDGLLFDPKYFKAVKDVSFA